MRVILGSQSPRRLELIRELYPLAEAIPLNIDEKAYRHPDPAWMAMSIAFAKAARLAGLVHERAIGITADTVVVVGDEVREKPADANQARQWLESYNSRPAKVITYVAVADIKKAGPLSVGIGEGATATVWFRDVNQEVIDHIVAEGTVLGCAGAFMVEHPLMEPYIAAIEGNPQTVQGLPLDVVRRLINDVFDGSPV